MTVGWFYGSGEGSGEGASASFPTHNGNSVLWENAALLPNETYSYFCPHDVMLMWGICHCRDCMSLWRPEEFRGQHAELIFGYAAKLADEIEKRWPGRRLAVLAYEGFESAPEGMDIPANLDVMLAQIRGPVSFSTSSP